MKHARDDYNRIQDPAGLIPEGEPVFLLRGQDALAPHILEIYAHQAERIGRVAIARLTRNQAAEMRRWQDEVRKKYPDLREGGE